MNVIVRRAGRRDADAVIALNAECFAVPWLPDILKKDISAHEYYIIEADGVIAGYACVWRVLEVAELMDICVTADMRRHGLGQALLAAAMLDAKERGAESMTLEVRRGNAAAIAMYEKHGFSCEGIRKGYYTDNGEDALIMWRRGL